MEVVVTIIGYGLIIYHFNFWLALGLWFVLWSNNLGSIRNSVNEKIIRLKEIWRDQL